MTHLRRPIRATDVDRVRELTSIGAGHAAKAFADLLGRPCRMRVPMVRVLNPGRASEALVSDGSARTTGVFFEVNGGLGGVVALLLSAETRGLLLEQLLGAEPAVADEAIAESALREFGNILVSHVVSAMADTLGVAVLPSVPRLVRADAPDALASLISLREPDRPSLRIETEISDREGGIRAQLIFVPDRATVIAAPARF